MHRTTVYFLTAAALLSSNPANSAPEELVIPGEIMISNLPTDVDIMNEFKRNRVRFITYHHEGFGPGIENEQSLSVEQIRQKRKELFPEYEKRRDARLSFTVSEWMRNLNKAHRTHSTNRNLGMIAYHYAVHPDGTIAKGRPVAFAPGTWATSSPGQFPDFSEHFAVVSLGDHNYEPMTRKALGSYIKVMSAAQRQYHVSTENILPHRHHANTDCPGDHTAAMHEFIVARVKTYSLQAELQERGCSPGPVDGVEGDRTRAAFARLIAATAGTFVSGSLDNATLIKLFENPGLRCQ